MSGGIGWDEMVEAIPRRKERELGRGEREREKEREEDR